MGNDVLHQKGFSTKGGWEVSRRRYIVTNMKKIQAEVKLKKHPPFQFGS